MLLRFIFATIALSILLVPIHWPTKIDPPVEQQATDDDKSKFVPPESVTGPRRPASQDQTPIAPTQVPGPVPEPMPEQKPEPEQAKPVEVQKPKEPVEPITHFGDGTPIPRPIVNAMAATKNWSMIVVEWTSKCPHADLDIVLRASDGTQVSQAEPTKPWGRLFHSGEHRPNFIPLIYQSREVAVVDSALCTEIWMDVHFSHDDGTAKVSMFRNGEWFEEDVAFSAQTNTNHSLANSTSLIRIANWALE